MKNINKHLGLFLGLSLTFSAMAETGHKKGEIQHIRVHGEAEHANWAPPNFWFTLEDVTSAGSCKTWHGNVLFVMDSEAALSIVLAAEMAGREVSVRYDDTILNGESWCKATYVTLGDPVPLY